MSTERQMEEVVQKLAGTYQKDIVTVQSCTVVSVDKDNRTCDCTPLGGDANTSIPGVLLCTENNNGLLVFPVVGSTVIVALSTRNTAFVMMYSDIEGFEVFIDENNKFTFDSTGFVWNEGTFGGLMKIPAFKTMYDSMIDAFKVAIAAGFTSVDTALNAIVPASGVSTVAFNGAAASVIHMVQATIEDTKIKH